MAKKKAEVKQILGYYKGDVARTVSFEKTKDEKIYVYSNSWRYTYFDPITRREIIETDEETCFKKWLELCMNNTYYKKDEKTLNLLKNIDNSIEFIEVE